MKETNTQKNKTEAGLVVLCSFVELCSWKPLAALPWTLVKFL